MATQLSREELRALFDSTKPWHHLIDVNGVPTKVEPAWGEHLDHPRGLWEKVAPLLRAIDARRLLDVGCNDGFFLFESRRLGVKDVVGVEVHPHYYDHAVLVNRLLAPGGVDIRRMSAYDVDETLGTFDVTLALGLIYHLKNPFLFLERVGPLTTTIIVETAVRNSDEDIRNREEGRPSPPSVEFVENPPSELNPEGAPNWWMPNSECVSALLRVCGFPYTFVASEQLLSPSPSRGPTEFGRAVVVGTKSERVPRAVRRRQFLSRARRRLGRRPF